jgi:hypothetical protein
MADALEDRVAMKNTREEHGRLATLGIAGALLLSTHCTNDAAGTTLQTAPMAAAVPSTPSTPTAPVQMPMPVMAGENTLATAGAAAPATPGGANNGTAPMQMPTQMQTPTTPSNGDKVPPATNPTSNTQAWPDPRRGCPGLNSGFPGDDACIAPPPPSEGLQIHIGPNNYDDPAEVNAFLLREGEEVSECWSYHTPNAEDVYFQGWTLSGRPGTHHIFNSMLTVEVADGGGFHVCVDAGLGNSPDRLGSLPGAAKPYMPRTQVAAENKGLGQLVKAKTPSEGDMHYFNYTQKEILREFWLNLYFIPKAEVTQEPIEVRGMGGLGWVGLPIAPGTDAVYKYECPISADGRLTNMLGHYHAHGKRETVSIRRANGNRDKIFEMYNYMNAAMFPFDSVTTNPPLADGIDGAVSGRIDVKAGDVLEWECHIVNDSDVPLTYSNSVQEGEMCNIFGMSVGTEINCLLL